MSEPQISRRAVEKFFTLLFSGKLSEAERTLERMRKRYKLGEDDPYYNALYRIYYTYVNDDKDSYTFQIWERFLEGESKRKLASQVKELLKTMHDPPERYLKAWLDLIELLDKLPQPHKIKKQVSQEAGREG